MTCNNPPQEETDGARTHTLVTDRKSESKKSKYPVYLSMRTCKHIYRYWDPLPIEANYSVVSLPSMMRKKYKAGVTVC